MIEKIIIPDLGATGADVTIAEWLVSVGDYVEVGQPLFSVETDKAMFEVEAFCSGFVREIYVAAGEEIELGTEVGLISNDIDEPISGGGTDTPIVTEPQGGPPDSTSETDVSIASVANSKRILASPRARRIAHEKGLDLGEIKGSGRDGIIHVRDLHVQVPSMQSPVGGLKRVRLSGVRRSIATVSRRSKAEIPHLYASVEIDVTNASEMIVRRSGTTQQTHITLEDLIVSATSRSLRKTPELNARVEGDEIVYYDSVYVGIATEVNSRILNPMIPNADFLSLSAIAAKRSYLVQKARAGKIDLDDLQDGTIAVCNLGRYGVDAFTAIIQPPHASVVACGAAAPRPVVRDGKVVIRTTIAITLSVDQRVTDGIVAAEFLCELKNQLEDPSALFEKR